MNKEELRNTLENISNRLFNLEKCLYLLVQSNEMANLKKTELACLGYVLYDYYSTTRNIFENLNIDLEI